MTSRLGYLEDLGVDTGSGIRGRDAGKARVHDHEKEK
jgi:hypothetical protein